MQLNVENIFNKGYWATADGNNNISPGQPRTVPRDGDREILAGIWSNALKDVQNGTNSAGSSAWRELRRLDAFFRSAERDTASR